MEKAYWNVAPFKYLPCNEVARGQLCIYQNKEEQINVRPGNQAIHPTCTELTKRKLLMKTLTQSIIMVAFAAKCWRNSSSITC